ncbi:NADP-dependent isocitrate dehydrogenase [Sodalis sp.]|uniref:NADP-dependent isocitrate dehydrogenase n=1 Tax=Sodalis sp. (in: enterobacteria) TaxID=1898979 RepID=UPI003873B8D9
MKNYARKHPPHGRMVGIVSIPRRLYVRWRFLRQRESALIERDGNVSITLVGRDGAKQILKTKTSVNAGEIIDAAVMSKKALSSFVVVSEFYRGTSPP